MYQIEKGIPMPEGKPGSKYPFDGMKVGDSFLVPRKDRSCVSSAATAYSKKYGTKFSMRTVDGVLRIWRIA